MNDDSLDALLRGLAAEGNPVAARFLLLPPERRQEAINRTMAATRRAVEAFRRVAEALGPVRLAAITAGASVDAEVFDEFPDDCWCCDGNIAATDIGLCVPCFVDLTGKSVR